MENDLVTGKIETVMCGDSRCSVVTSDELSVAVRTDVYIYSLIVDCDHLEENAACVCADRSESVLRFRHGLNTCSMFSAHGGWVIGGPSREFLLQTIEACVPAEALLAAANVERQWLFARDSLQGATKRMGRIVAGLVPGFDTMDSGRSSEVADELAELCKEFANAAGCLVDRLALSDLPFDLTPGAVTVPRDAVRDGVLSCTVEEMETLSSASGPLAFATLEYWWESMFMGWWKGFW